MPWTPDADQRRFIREFGERILGDQAALFIGAGTSRDAGFVDWSALLRHLAKDLELDIKLEHDLPAVAQYHHNHDESREKITRTIIEAMSRDAEPTEVHRIISRLPIDTIWTTNYESLIEDTCRSAGRVVEVKRKLSNLAQARQGRDLVVYKMHGCITDPDDAVLTKDDYDLYDTKRSLFTDALKGDFVEKTFLFLGFSFTDPNIERVLAKLRSQLPQNLRTHYWITRQPTVDPAADAATQETQRLARRRAELKSADLKRRNGIHTVWVKDFSDVPRLLAQLEAYVCRKSTFVSGAARDTAPLGENKLRELCEGLGDLIVRRGGTLVSGFGRGIGGDVVLGALRAFYAEPQGRHEDRLVLRPFPGAVPEPKKAEAYARHRTDLISRAGAVVVISGNRADGAGIVPSPGVSQEISIAQSLGRVVIPVGATGHAAHEHWTKAMHDPNAYLGAVAPEGDLEMLGNPAASVADLLNAIARLLDRAEVSASATYQH